MYEGDHSPGSLFSNKEADDMRVLFLANHLNTGGITTYLITLTRSFIGRGHSVWVVSSGGNMVPELEATGARHIDMPLHVKCEVHPGLFLMIPRLVALVRTEKIDMIHAQTRVTQMCAALASGMSAVPCVSTCHGFFRPHLGRRLMPLWGKKVIAVSSPVKEHLRSDFHLSPDSVALVINGIDLKKFVPLGIEARRQLRSRWGLANDLVLGIVARLSDVKGHQYLIDAIPAVLASLPAVKCLIFGDGPLRDELKEKVQKKGLEGKILFYPIVDQTAEVLPLLDVFVMPSIQEGLGLSVLEAAAMGIPSVVSRVGGLPDIVQEGITGALVAPRDPVALAAALIALLSDIPRAISMGEKAREFVRRHYSAERMADETLSVYREVGNLQ